MSTPYGTGVGQPPIGQPGKVNFGWISESFQFFSQAAAVWVALVAILFVCSIVISLILNVIAPSVATSSPFPMGGDGSNPLIRALTAQSPVHSIFSQGTSILLNAFFGANAFNLALMQVKGQQITFNDMFAGTRNIVQMLIFAVLYYVASLVGLVACCIGIFFVMGLILPVGAMIADGIPAIDAFTRSINAMKGDLVSAAGFVFVFGLLTAVSCIPCGLGLLVTVPMTYLISCLAYRDIVGFGGGGGGVYAGGPVGSPGAWPPPVTGGQSGFGQPQPPQSGFGQPQPPQSGFGQPQPPQSGFGQPQPPQSGFGQPQPPQSGFGQPQPPQSGFGQPQPPQSGFGQPQPPQSGFGQPQPPQSGFGQPQPPQSGFGQPQPPQSGFSQPTPPQSGFSQPTPPQSGFSQPTPPQSGFGQPQPGQSQFGQPQPGQSPFGQAQPPAGQQPFGQNVFGNQNDVPPAAHPPQFGQPPADPTNPGTGGQ